MPKARCECGATYQVPESALGKRATCKKCGHTFQLASMDPLHVQPLTDKSELSRRASDSQNAQVVIIDPPEDDVEVGVPSNAYTACIIRSFAFLTSGGAIVDFIVMWVALLVIPWIWFGDLFVAAWYAAFRFNIITDAAAGEDELPSATSWSNLFDDFVRPLINWVLAGIFAAIPVLTYLTLRGYGGSPLADWAVDTFLAGIGGSLRSVFEQDIMLGVMSVLGIFLWPMILLCVALGGYSSVFRVDLIAVTIIKTLPGYALTAIVVFTVMAVQQGIADAALGVPGGPVGFLGGRVMQIGLKLYLEIAAMRMIGFYYYYFKSKFAWSWE